MHSPQDRFRKRTPVMVKLILVEGIRAMRIGRVEVNTDIGSANCPKSLTFRLLADIRSVMGWEFIEIGSMTSE
jgi:hypothetical protein